MKISFSGAPEYMDRTVGYGEASYHIFENFKKLGVNAVVKDPESLIGISFTYPTNYSFAKHHYKIGYTPWESTEFMAGWKDAMNSCDEVWATSQWTADVYREQLNVPIFVYEHGIEDRWIPKKRSLKKDKPFRFLHVGEPAFRKDAQMVVDAFIANFGDNPNYELILKCSKMNTTRVFDKESGAVLGSPDAFYPNIKIIESFLSVNQMNSLYDLCDVFVYPSWGEGFGFNPLQSMAMGMPTICTSEWAPYAEYITMPLGSRLATSPWQDIHPGMMLKPDYLELKEHMLNATKDYDKFAKIAFKNSFMLHQKFDWLEVSKPAVKRLEKIHSRLI